MTAPFDPASTALPRIAGSANASRDDVRQAVIANLDSFASRPSGLPDEQLWRWYHHLRFEITVSNLRTRDKGQALTALDSALRKDLDHPVFISRAAGLRAWWREVRTDLGIAPQQRASSPAAQVATPSMSPHLPSARAVQHNEVGGDDRLAVSSVGQSRWQPRDLGDPADLFRALDQLPERAAAEFRNTGASPSLIDVQRRLDSGVLPPDRTQRARMVVAAIERDAREGIVFDGSPVHLVVDESRFDLWHATYSALHGSAPPVPKPTSPDITAAVLGGAANDAQVLMRAPAANERPDHERLMDVAPAADVGFATGL